MTKIRKLDIATQVSDDDRALARSISSSPVFGDPDLGSISSIEIERAWQDASRFEPRQLESLKRLSATLGVPVPDPFGPSRADRIFGPARADEKTGQIPRKTRVLATVGPASSDPELLAEMIERGMDGARVNFSHVKTADEARAIIGGLREAMKIAGREIPIIADLQGPKIRVGDLDAPMTLETGSAVKLVPAGEGGGLPIPPKILADLAPGERVLIDDGKIELRVLSREGGVSAEVVRGGPVSSRKGINLPDSALTARVPTEKDLADLAVLRELGVDTIMVSFVQDASDLERVRKAYGAPVKLIAKIERQQAMENIEQIMAASDGVLVARGDGAVELGDAEMPVAQRRIHTLGNRTGVATGTATQMLESMLTSPRPSRADASDIARAAFEGSDFVMTSAETAIGPSPVEIIKTMSKILEAAERAIRTGTVR
jgi:pyruvate kinase